MDKLDLESFSVMQLIELDACTRCGECVTWCPTYQEKQSLEEITPLSKIERVRSFFRARQLGRLGKLLGVRGATEERLASYSSGTYDCTLCGRCGVVCPVHIQTRKLWISMREMLVRQGVYPENLDHLRETVTTHYNISGDPNDDRLIWSRNLPQVPEGVGGKKQAQVAYFVGCVSSFYPQSYAVPQAIVEVMEGAGVDYMTMGGDEWCCGFPLMIAGMGESAADLVRHNTEAIRKTGAELLVTGCPSCYHTFKHEYPRLLGEPLGFEVKHFTELMEGLIDGGKLHLEPLEETVTFHDPCDLGRSAGVYDAPRNVIAAIPGINFVEMEHHHDYSLCCGGGGDVEMADKDLAAAVAKRRVEEAQATGAKTLLSACQQCSRTLAGAARRDKVRIRVMDVAQLVARQLKKS